MIESRHLSSQSSLLQLKYHQAHDFVHFLQTTPRKSLASPPEFIFTLSSSSEFSNKSTPLQEQLLLCRRSCQDVVRPSWKSRGFSTYRLGEEGSDQPVAKREVGATEANTFGVLESPTLILKLRSISPVPLIICCYAKESGFASHP